MTRHAKERIGVIGGGSWGATLADHLARKGNDVSLWEFQPAAAESLKKTRTLAFMPQLRLHPSVEVTSDLAEVLSGRAILVSAVPSEHVRATFRAVREKNTLSPGAWVVSVTKGIETDTLKRMSEIIAEEVPPLQGRVAVLSGPSHAEEVAKSIPTAIVSAGPGDLPEKVQALFNSDSLRVYTSDDGVGVELGGAVKNIYAIACGICDGLGLGDNTKAALMTRGLYEMTRLGKACGAQEMTFLGLSGMGDLIVTCMSRHSRNRLLGEKIGQGRTLDQALKEMTMVAEGVRTTKSVHQLAHRIGLEMPIVNQLHLCLYEGKSAGDCVRDLLTRPVTSEMKHLRKEKETFAETL
ncbi:MAG: NAD(P)-dependent glycerol-3-phosphate dehydrogenase [Elusimicrobia bacterium]|nr:NAD(P)-dependent glycerol-3-phosphate dehydrogenase [Elusimicrobiota bacterium]